MAKYLLILFLLVLHSNAIFGQSDPDIDRLVKSVVIVKIYDNNGIEQGHGSGVIIDSKGTCITNYHVLEDAYFVKIVTEDGNEFDMEKITGENKDCDLVRFTIKHSGNNFHPVTICRKSPTRGKHIWAIGTPIFLENKNSVTDGIISKVYSDWRFRSDTVFQITADISHGSSGGGLFNSKGELVGITFMQFSGADAGRAGLNYAIYIGEISKLHQVYKDRLESATTSIAKTIDLPIEPPKSKLPQPELPKYKVSEPPKDVYHEPDKTGRVSFYTDLNDVIEVTVDGWRYDKTTLYWKNLTVPNCGQYGTATFTLPIGTHNYKAETHSHIWTGTVNITADDCQLKLITKSSKKHSQYKFPKNILVGDFSKNFSIGYDLLNNAWVFQLFVRRHQSYTPKGKNFIEWSFGIPGGVFNNGEFYKLPVKIGVSYNRVLMYKKDKMYYPYYGASIQVIDNIVHDPNNTDNVNNTMSLSSANTGNFIQFYPSVRAGILLTLFRHVGINGGIGYGYLTNSTFQFDFKLSVGYKIDLHSLRRK